MSTYNTINITGVTSTNLTSFPGVVYGNVNWNTTGQTATGALTAPITVAGSLNIASGTLSDNGYQITGNVTNTLTVGSGATLALGADAATTFPTSFTSAHTTLTGSTVIYNSNSPQTISNVPAYNNLTLSSYTTVPSRTGTITTAAGSATVTGVSTLFTGELSVGSMIVTSTGLPIGVVSSLGSATSLTLSSFAFNYVTVGQNYYSPVLKTLAGSGTVINGTLTVNNLNELSDGGFAFGANGGSSSLVVNSGGFLQLSSNYASTPYLPTFGTGVAGNYSFASGSWVNYNAGATQAISNIPAYSNLIANSSVASITKTVSPASGAMSVAGSLTIGNNVTFADGGNTITVNGNIANNSVTGHTGSGLILLTGGSAIHTLSSNLSPIGSQWPSYTNLQVKSCQWRAVQYSMTVSGTFTDSTGIFYINNSTYSTADTLKLSSTSANAVSAVSGSNSGLGGTTISFFYSGAGAAANNIGTAGFATGYQNLGNLTLNRSTGSFNLGSSVTLNSATGLALTAGLLYLGNNNLILSSASTYTSGALGTNIMVVADGGVGTGKFMKTFLAGNATTFTYPIGNTSGTAIFYSPVTLNSFNPTGANRTIGFNVTDAVHPHMNNLATQINYLSRYWTAYDDGGTLSGGTSTGYTYGAATAGIVFTYNNTASDVHGTLSSGDEINRWDGTSWYQQGVIPPASFNTGYSGTISYASSYYSNVDSLYISGQYYYGAPLVGGSSFPATNDFTVRVDSNQTYTWPPTSGSADFNTPANWSPNRLVPAITDILLFNNAGTTTAINVPTQQVQQFLVTNSTNVTLQPFAVNSTATPINYTFTISGSGTTGVNIFNIASGSSVTINNGGINTLALTMVNGTSSIGTIAGTLTNNSTTFTTAGTVYISGTYVAGYNGPSLPSATWTNQGTVTTIGTLNVTGVTTSNASWPSGTYGFVTWNCPNQIATSANGAINNTMTLNGDLTVSSGTFNMSTYTISMVGNTCSVPPQRQCL